jgi:hypothetical protein
MIYININSVSTFHIDVQYMSSVCLCVCVCIQGVSRLVDITEGGDFLGLCDQESSYKHVSDFGQLRSYEHSFIPVRALV